MISKPQIKYIQSLRHKKYRRQHAAFVAEGDKLVVDLIESGQLEVQTLYATDRWLQEHATQLHPYQKVSVHPLLDHELEKISSLTTPNQVLGIFKLPAHKPEGLRESGLQLLLDGIQDPGNLGTIIRIADWFGLPHIWCSQQTVDCFNAKVLQATMGSIARVQVHYVDLEGLILSSRKMPVYAATLDGQSMLDLPKVSSCALIIGNESNGVSEALLGITSLRITIPRIGHAESLNAAVAAGILCSKLVYG